MQRGVKFGPLAFESAPRRRRSAGGVSAASVNWNWRDEQISSITQQPLEPPQSNRPNRLIPGHVDSCPALRCDITAARLQP